MGAAKRPGFRRCKGCRGARLCRRLWPAGAGRLCKRVVKKVLRFDGPCGAEGGIALWGVRVQRVQKVQRVQRVVDCPAGNHL